jgi:putative ABC transport system permease protein
VLSHALWAGRFGADPRVVGRQVRLAGVAHTVVGVMPASFDPTLSGEQLWVPLALTPERKAEHDDHHLFVVGLLKPGATRERASAEVDAAMRELARRFPDANPGRGGAVRPLREELVGAYRRRLFVTLGAVTLVLLIACGNVANLLLARGGARARELALRASLGAGRGRIVRQLLTESLVLGLGAAAVGVALAYAGARALVAAAPPGIPRLAETRIDGAVLLFALGAAVASAVLFGLAPALRAARQDVQGALRAGGRGLGLGRDRMRGGLVAAEVALALTLLAGAGVLVRSAVALQRVPPGFDPAGVVVGRVSLPAAAYATPERTLAAFLAVGERLGAAPGVRRAAITTQPPLGPGRSTNGLIPEGRPLDARSAIPARLHLVTPGYFATMGVRLARGRDFVADDRHGRERVVIVSEAFARAAWPGQDPIGKRLACCEGGPGEPTWWKTVVGVAGDVRADGPAADAPPEFYLPIAQAPADAWDWIQRAVTLVARGDAAAGEDGGAALVSAMRAAVRDVDPGVPLYGVTTMRDALAGSMADARFNTLLLTLLAAIGLVLSAVGVYGVAAYFVTLRAHEIGVRLALGATPRGVLRLMLWQGLRPAALGVLVGAAVATGALRLLRGAVFGVSPTDPASVVAAGVVLLAAAALATAVPAWRAARADATRALASA